MLDWAVKQLREGQLGRSRVDGIPQQSSHGFGARGARVSSVCMSSVLEKIVEHKRGEIAAAQARVPAVELEAKLKSAPPVRHFVDALRSRKGMALIAEIKKASPSAGLIRDDFDPVAIARTYEQHGAACISVLTDERFFQGRLDDLRAVRQAVGIPVLRKDFLLDRYQVLEARAAGADCVLLIAECLADAQLGDLYGYARALGMDALIEIYEPDNLARVLSLGPALVGINNRDLKTFVTDLDHSVRLAALLPENVILVSESGIGSRTDVERLQSAGIRAILVGETLMRASDIGAKVREFVGGR